MGFDIPGLSKVKKAFSRATGMERAPVPLEGLVIDGRFEILRKIGSGGMGSVYLARQTSMNRNVAIKVLNPDKINDQDARERFRVEASAVSRLRSPHTISVYDFGEDESGGLFLVMELLEGCPLSDIINKRGYLPARTAVAIADQILESLDEAHQSGVLHRDLKPENVFVKENPDGSVFIKVLDFGIAKVMGGPMSSRTWAGVVFGTPAYMSPEQVMGRDLDQRTDLYAVAVVLFEMLTGKLPITGGTPIEIGVKKVRTRPPTLESANPAVQYPPGASAFLSVALDPDRKKRPADAREFRNLMMAAFGMTQPVSAAPADRRPSEPLPDGSPVLVAIDHVITSAWKYGGERLVPSTSGPGPAPVARKKPITTKKTGLKPSTAGETSPGLSASKPGVSNTAAPSLVREEPLAAFDRRARRRVQRLVTTQCFYNGQKYTATIADISGSGAFINSSWLPVVGHRITVSFSCPGAREYTISIMAEVVRISSGAGNDLRGFAVRWLRMKARGGLACITKFMDATLGVELKTSLPDSTSLSVWEYNFEDGRFV